MTTISNNNKRRSSVTTEVTQSSPAIRQMDSEVPEHLMPAADSSHKVQVHKVEEYQGYQSISPLPPSHELVALEQIQPGITNRLLCLVEGEQAHRHALDNQEQKALIGLSKRDHMTVKRSQRYALVVSLVSLGVAAAVAIWGHPWAGALIAGLDIAGIVASFLYGTKRLREIPASGTGGS